MKNLEFYFNNLSFNSISVPNSVESNSKLNGNAKLIYSELLFRMRMSVRKGRRFFDKALNQYYVIYPIVEMAYKIGSSKGTVIRSLRKLEKLGLILRKRLIHRTLIFLPKLAKKATRLPKSQNGTLEKNKKLKGNTFNRSRNPQNKSNKNETSEGSKMELINRKNTTRINKTTDTLLTGKSRQNQTKIRNLLVLLLKRLLRTTKSNSDKNNVKLSQHRSGFYNLQMYQMNRRNHIPLGALRASQSMYDLDEFHHFWGIVFEAKKSALKFKELHNDDDPYFHYNISDLRAGARFECNDYYKNNYFRNAVIKITYKAYHHAKRPIAYMFKAFKNYFERAIEWLCQNVETEHDANNNFQIPLPRN